MVQFLTMEFKTLQINDVSGGMGKNNRAARAVRFLV